jgi:hypothetical protein
MIEYATGLKTPFRAMRNGFFVPELLTGHVTVTGRFKTSQSGSNQNQPL